MRHGLVKRFTVTYTNEFGARMHVDRFGNVTGRPNWPVSYPVIQYTRNEAAKMLRVARARGRKITRSVSWLL